MSVYAINRVGHDVLHDHAFREQLQSDPEAALAPFELTDEERAALVAGDVGALYGMGAHEYLLMNLARFNAVGLDPKTFSSRMRAAGTTGGG